MTGVIDKIKDVVNSTIMILLLIIIRIVAGRWLLRQLATIYRVSYFMANVEYPSYSSLMAVYKTRTPVEKENYPPAKNRKAADSTKHGQGETF